MPLPRAGRPTARAVESVKASAPLQTAARRPLVVVVVVVVVVRTPTPTARLGTPVQTLSKLSPHECAPVHARRSSGDEGRASKHVERPSILPATGFNSASRRALLLMRSPHASVVSADR